MKPKRGYIIGYQKIFCLLVIENIRRITSDISSRSQMIFKIRVLKTFAKFTGKHLKEAPTQL